MSARDRERSERAIVVGAGAAGLGVAAELRRRGVDALVFDRALQVGGGWAGRYEGLRLNTVRQLSGLRGSPIPRRAGRWVSRQEFAAYLRGISAGMRVEAEVEVERVDRDGDGWVLSTSAGSRFAAAVVVAAGYDREPFLPDWPGLEGYAGELMHSSAYREAARHRGQDVLVVGPGNSGSEIATQLSAAGAGRVRLSVRTPVNLFPATVLGAPSTWLARANEEAPERIVDSVSRLTQRLAFGDLSGYGMPPAPRGVATELRERGLGPVLDRGFVRALKRGDIEIVAAVSRCEAGSVILADRTSIEPDMVIAATGYCPGLAPLVGHLGVLDDRGLPLVRDGSTEISGSGSLYFNGYWLPLSGQLPAMRRSSRRIAGAIARRGLQGRDHSVFRG